MVSFCGVFRRSRWECLISWELWQLKLSRTCTALKQEIPWSSHLSPTFGPQIWRMQPGQHGWSNRFQIKKGLRICASWRVCRDTCQMEALLKLPTTYITVGKAWKPQEQYATSIKRQCVSEASLLEISHMLCFLFPWHFHFGHRISCPSEVVVWWS